MISDPSLALLPVLAVSPILVIGALVAVLAVVCVLVGAIVMTESTSRARVEARATRELLRTNSPSMSALKSLPVGTNSDLLARVAVDAVRLLDQGVSDPIYQARTDYDGRARKIISDFYGINELGDGQ